MKTGDIVGLFDRNNTFICWEVSAVCLGALEQESIVELCSLTKKRNQEPYRVPIQLIENATLYVAQPSKEL